MPRKSPARPATRRNMLKKLSAGAPLVAAAGTAEAQNTANSQKSLFDRLAIREVIENWVLYRDAGDWERFKTVWHDDGYMMATWFQGTAAEFAKVSREGMEKGVSILHFLGGITIDISANRAIAQTKMSISQRAPVHNVVCDVVCVGRFYDFLEKRNDRWAIVLRRLTYEKDRMDPVDPSGRITLDPKILSRYPAGYQHLAYLPAGLGFPVKTNMPGLRGPDTDALYARGKAWLAGKPMDESFRA
jgi:hypothetical protein